MSQEDNQNSYVMRSPRDQMVSSGRDNQKMLEHSGSISNSNMEGSQSVGVSWLPAAMVVDSEQDSSSQAFVLDDSTESGHGIYVQIPYQIVSDETNHDHLHTSIMSQSDNISCDDQRNGEMKLMVKFGETVCPLSMFGLDASSFVGKIDHSGVVDDSEEMFDRCDSNFPGSASSMMDDSEKNSSGYCSLCGKYIKDSIEMEKHLIYHQDTGMSVPSGPGVACIDLSVAHKSCPVCGNQLRHHESFSQRDFQTEFRTIEQLTNIPMFTCDECGKDYALGISQDAGCSDSDAISSQNPNGFSYSINMNSNYGYNPDSHFSRDSASISDRSNPNSLNRFVCSECGKSYKHNRDLRKHVRTRHAGSEADLYLNSKNGRNYQHKNSFTGIKSEDGSEVSERFFHVDGAMMSANSSVVGNSGQSTSAKLMCDLCKKFFRGPFELRRHIKTVHENNRPFKCQSCDKSFRDAHELRRHNAGHQRPTYQYSQNHGGGGLNPHESSFSDMKYSYAKQESLVDSDSPLSSLSRSQHGNFPSSAGDHSIDHNSSSNSMFQESYLIPNSSLYSSNDHSGSMIVQTTAADIPSSTMSKVHQLNVGSVGNDYFCSACEKNFRGANEFKRHYSVVHEKKYRYKCIHCGKLWRDQYDLKRHCKRSHFLDQDIDKSFIKQCLLANGSLASNSSVISQTTEIASPCMTNTGTSVTNSGSYSQVNTSHMLMDDRRKLDSSLLHGGGGGVESITQSDSNNHGVVVNRNDMGVYVTSHGHTDYEIPCCSAPIGNLRSSGNILFTCDFSPHQVVTSASPSASLDNNGNKTGVPCSSVSPVHHSWSDLMTGNVG